MKPTKDGLDELYSSMSIDQMAKHLGLAKSTLYYYMRKFGIQRRSKSDAQVRHLKHSPHQRLGKSHSDETRDSISDGARNFWESERGIKQKKSLGTLRRKEWKNSSPRKRLAIIDRLQSATRPEPGHLSRFGVKLAEFLRKFENVSTGIQLTPSHVSDIILEDRHVVIELLLPISVYGEEQEQKVESRYSRLIAELNSVGYRVVIIEDLSNTLSKARCQRVYNQLTKFFEQGTLQSIKIIS